MLKEITLEGLTTIWWRPCVVMKLDDPNVDSSINKC